MQKMWICLKLLKKAEKRKQDIAKEFGIPANMLPTIIKIKGTYKFTYYK